MCAIAKFELIADDNIPRGRTARRTLRLRVERQLECAKFMRRCARVELRHCAIRAWDAKVIASVGWHPPLAIPVPPRGWVPMWRFQ